MKKIKLGNTGVQVPAMIIGCMRMNTLGHMEAEHFIKSAIDMGLNYFDHADIYGNGQCEEIFARAVHMSSSVREKLILQSKCGIRNGMYDFSKEYIMESVEGILRRLRTDYLDVLALHRPDALVDPVEVAEAVDILQRKGMIRYFGVSNHNSMQIQLIQKYLGTDICINQMQFGLAHCGMVKSGLNVNTEDENACDRDGDVMNFCRLNNITLQAWSPLQYGMFQGTFLGNDKFKELNKKIDELSEKYHVSGSAVVAAWIWRHPADLQVVSGTMKIQHLKEMAMGMDIPLTKKEWYELYIAGGCQLL